MTTKSVSGCSGSSGGAKAGGCSGGGSGEDEFIKELAKLLGKTPEEVKAGLKAQGTTAQEQLKKLSAGSSVDDLKNSLGLNQNSIASKLGQALTV